ncbi:MAG: SDR family NAD(P)-dependent oxidoreductase [Deltaproteobacteria bacterium]|nr:SDR family NAD(P)-dependent oxidoreductase [Deltaproteobacteria bacterium]
MRKKNWQGTNTVVTGAASGLGRAFCEQLVREGARVLASDVDEVGLAALTRDLDAGARLETHVCNVADADAVEAMAARAEQLWGPVDLLVNNAGVATAGPIGDVPLSEWRRVFEVNFWGVVHGCHSFVPKMRLANKGCILNVASLAGLLSAPKMAAYNTSKSAVVSLSETLRAELEGCPVTVSVLCPAFFPTEIIARMTRFGPGADQAARLGEKLMERSSWSAKDIAVFALEGALAQKLYLVPHREARVGWVLKRLAPERFPLLAKRLTSAPKR